MKSKFTESKRWGSSVKNLGAIAAVAVTLVGRALNAAIAGPAPPTGIKNVVLVHGAFADGSGWEAVADILKKDGYTVSVVQQPENSFAEDVKSTKAMIDRQSEPVLLVGHSYGGVVITEAGNDPKVAALVYIAAFVPEAGESAAQLNQSMSRPQRVSRQPAMATSSWTRQSLRLTSPQMPRRRRPISWPCRRFWSPLTRLRLRSRPLLGS
jgi:pimeloyl-ACP methyl ester carboxylesterase